MEVCGQEDANANQVIDDECRGGCFWYPTITSEYLTCYYDIYKHEVLGRSQSLEEYAEYIASLREQGEEFHSSYACNCPCDKMIQIERPRYDRAPLPTCPSFGCYRISLFVSPFFLLKRRDVGVGARGPVVGGCDRWS